MSNNRNQDELTNAEMRKLLHEIDEHDEKFQLMDLDEVDAIEAEFQTFDSTHLDTLHQPIFNDLINEFANDAIYLSGIVARAQELSMGVEELATRLRLGPDIVIKLERRLLQWVPDTLVWMLTIILKVNKTDIYGYLQQQPIQPKIAASSKKPPSASRTQSWKEAIEASKMSSEDKEFWLKQV